jgi:uncharacterized protein (TIGR03435 family)
VGRASAYVVLACAVLPAQATQFETASVRPSAATARQMPARRIRNSPGRVVYEEQSLKDLLFLAYRVPFFRLPTPQWMEEEFFDVAATFPEGATKDDAALMLQSLLADRFQLKLHRESRNLTGYVLTLGKGPSKLTPSPPTPEGETQPTGLPRKLDLDKEGFAILPTGMATLITVPAQNGVTRVTAARQPLSTLISYLGRILQQPIVDETGLAGIFDFHLAYAASHPPEHVEASALPEASEPAPTIVQAVEKQLGLRMERRRVPVDILVIDHIERRPVEN